MDTTHTTHTISQTHTPARTRLIQVQRHPHTVMSHMHVMHYPVCPNGNTNMTKNIHTDTALYTVPSKTTVNPGKDGYRVRTFTFWKSHIEKMRKIQPLIEVNVF